MRQMRLERVRRGLTIFTVAKKTEISTSKLFLLERELVEATPDECKRLARLFGMDPEILLASTEDVSPIHAAHA